MNLRRLFILWLFAMIAGNLQAQTRTAGTAVSDTTKSKKDSVAYGPSTTHLFYGADVYRDLYRRYRVDTSIVNLHRYSFVQRNLYTVQDLGNLGTAAQSIFYRVPSRVGTTLGYTAYDIYLFDPENFKYYDTFSPFSELQYTQGGKGRSLLQVRLSRNVTPEWNVGVVYQRINSNKVIGRAARRNNTYTAHQTFGLHTHFFSRSGRYKALANFTNYDHLVEESGGYAMADTMTSLRDLFEDKDWLSQLALRMKDVRATQSRNHFYLYQQLGILDTVKFQLFHVLNWSGQKNGYRDKNYKSHLDTINGSKVYDSLFFGPTRAEAKHSSVYQLIDNKIGLKGRIAKFGYMGYLQMRNYSFSTTYIKPKTTRDTTETWNIPAEYFIGGSLRYQVTDSTKIDMEAEYMPGNRNQSGTRQTADYRLKAELGYRFIYAGLERAFYRPNLLQRRFNGNFIRWDNRDTLVNTLADRIYGGLRLDLPLVKLNPYASFTNIHNYIYYDTTARPKQADRDVRILQVGLNAEANWKKWHNQTNIIYSRHLGADLIPMPSLIINTEVYYQDYIFNNAMFAQFGVDLAWRSSYRAMDYMPVTQQFHLQNQFRVNNYLFADVFFNFRIRRALLFLKMTNILQGVPERAAFVTPRYLTLPRSFEFGIKWLFFD